MISIWIRRRWFDFRLGHSTYLIFLLTFANFILIFHRLLIERIEWLDNVLGELWLFSLLFAILYVPVAIASGAWHRKNQLKVEADTVLLQSPLVAKIYRIMLDMQTGRAKPEEIEELQKILKNVEDKNE